MKSKSKSVLGLIASCTMLCSLSGAYGELLYKWDFNNADGSNTGSGTDGTLTANVGAGATTGSFSQAGVSGNSWDFSLRTNNGHDVWFGTDVGNAAGVGNLDLSTVNQFTITMWIKQNGGNDNDLLNIGSAATPTSASNPGISIGLNGFWDNGMRVGVNGYNGWVGDLWSPGTDDDWVFVAIAYDGTDIENVWENATMNGLYGQNRNVAFITGDTITSASAVNGINLHTGDWGTPVGNVSLAADATAFLGTDGTNARGFNGNMDDVRIYSGLLTVAEIEEIRQSAFAEPSPDVDLYWKGGDLVNPTSWTSPNWTIDIAGTVPGGALPADGSYGIAFATTDADIGNLSTDLGANQNVRSIVVTAGSGPVYIGGSHDLTIGEGGIWLELTAAALNIETAGGVILDVNQTWKNKSPNPLSVNSALSGIGTLTKSGMGLLLLGGDNSLLTGGMVVEQGSMSIYHANALGGPSASLTMNGSTLDLNGLDVSLGALAGANGSIIRSNSPCTLTLDLAANSTYGCSINEETGGGPVSLVKKGEGNATSTGAGNFSGPVTIESGQFIANHPNYGGAPTSSSLGNVQVPGRTITVTAPGSLALTNNNIFGNQNGDSSLLPLIIVNETTMSASNYNLIGDITLNAATLSQTTGNTGNYQGYQFRGGVKVTGTAGASTISGSGGNHLSVNTIFDVEEVIAGDDLSITAPLIDRSGDFGLGRGGFTKTGAGTMRLSGASTYTGSTVVSEGTLALAIPSLSDIRTTRVAAGATLHLDFPVENNTDTVGSLVLNDVILPIGTYGADHPSGLITGTGFIQVVGLPDPFGDWIATFPSLAGQNATRGADPDLDGQTNIEEFAFNSIPDSGAASGKFRSSVEIVNSQQAFVLTLPVRAGAAFTGNTPAAIATSEDDQLAYRIEGTNDLTTFDQAVSEVPAASSGLPALETGWIYRSFRLNGNIDGANPRGPKGFLRAVVIDNP